MHWIDDPKMAELVRDARRGHAQDLADIALSPVYELLERLLTLLSTKSEPAKEKRADAPRRADSHPPAA